MKIVSEIGDDEIAKVYIGKTTKGSIIEFVESIPTHNIKEKWVLIISSLNGCPVGCKMCDAGFFYKGKLEYEELMEQIEYPIMKRFKDIKPTTKKFKVQFARMGEPSFNMNVLDVIADLGNKYENFYPSLSTVAPVGVDKFFERLMEIKKEKYPQRFQLQFSIHTTSEWQRDEIIPVHKWSFEKISRYGEEFYDRGGRKITLNFALAEENEVVADVIERYFHREYFLIKITPVNPTINALKNHISNDVDNSTGLPKKHHRFVNDLKNMGYDVILSVGDARENLIGSNCGMYILRYMQNRRHVENAYAYVEKIKKVTNAYL